jgi:MFS family permease
MTPPARLATAPYLLMCLVACLAYANQYGLMPVIPLFVDHLGHSPFVAGLVLLAFSLPSFIVRPVLGRIADRSGAAAVLAGGTLLLGAVTLPLLLPSLFVLFCVNVMRGLGWAGVNTGAYAVLAAVAPPARRGEASGYFNAALSATAVLVPAVGLWLLALPGGFRNVFLAGAGIALTGGALALVLVRMVRRPAAAPRTEEAGSKDWIDRGVLVATGINLCTAMVYPSLVAFTPLAARTNGIAHVEWFYIVSGVATIVLQPLIGRMSDRVSRGTAITAGLLAQLAGLLLVLYADEIVVLSIGGFVASTGMALVGSITTALAMDQADPRHRGRAMATYSMSWQLGAGGGALMAGGLADLLGFRGMYAGCVVVTLIGFAVLYSARAALARPRGEAAE